MTERKKRVRVKNSQTSEYREELKPKTSGQSSYIRAMIENEVIFGIGPAGTGKSYCALGLAAQYLLEGKVKHIVIARPTVEASPRGLGYLPGKEQDKLSPYVRPAVEHLKRFLGKDQYLNYFRDGKIKIEALEYLRGTTFNDSFMIGEEFQNATTDQIKMFVTRIGENSKIVIDGDIDQADTKRTNSEYLTDLEYVLTKVKEHNLRSFAVVELTELDIVRNKLISDFIRIFPKRSI